MKQIKADSLLCFQEDLDEHKNILAKNSSYDFSSNFAIIKELFKGDMFTEKDLVAYVSEDKFMMGLDLEDEQLDDWKYIFDAFNVYLSTGSSIYFKDTELTKNWRSLMKTTYPNSTYVADLKKEIESERKQRIAEINAEIDKEIDET